MRGGGFRGTSFSHAELQDALLSGADLTGASFYESDLRDADLKGAVLRGAHLNRSNLQGVKIDDKTDLSGADLSDVVGLCVDDIIAAGVITDKDTKSPPLKCQKNPSWQEDGCLPKEDHR